MVMGLQFEKLKMGQGIIPEDYQHFVQCILEFLVDELLTR